MRVLSVTSTNSTARCAVSKRCGSLVFPRRSYPNARRLHGERRGKIGGPVDVADRARAADGNLDELRLVRGEHVLRPFVAGQRLELGAQAAREADGVAAARAPVGRGEQRAGSERV